MLNTSTYGKCELCIIKGPKSNGIKRNIAIKNIHPVRTPIASGLKLKKKYIFKRMYLVTP